MGKTTNYDSEFCGSVPLHNVNLIQPHGYLLVVDSVNYQIVQASENVIDIFGIPIEKIINTLLTDYIDSKEKSLIKEKFTVNLKNKLPLTLNISGRKLLTLAHIKKEYLLLELENYDDHTERYFTHVFQEIKYSMASIEHAETIAEVSKIAIKEIKEISGFDGIMMYRFDKDWNGTVIAEEKEPGMEKYLGLTFPASDIPKQARQMYKNNAYRLIPNREYVPVKLFPVINPLTNSFIDLFDCNLRSVASVHLEYLKNMDVIASMSIRILVNGNLWGLIACHHRTARYLNFEVCSVLELLSSVISNKISSILYKEHYDFAKSLQESRTRIIENIFSESNVLNGIVNDENINILNLLNATGAAIVKEGVIETTGKVPDRNFLDNLNLWLQGKKISKVFSSDRFVDLYDEANEYVEIASGILVIPMSKNLGDYIICFRPEMKQTINWSGDPNQAINFENDKKSYHPRNSFKIWQQTVEATSMPWHEQELETAEGLRSFLYEFNTR